MFLKDERGAVTLEKTAYLLDENGFGRVTRVKYFQKENGGVTSSIFDLGVAYSFARISFHLCTFERSLKKVLRKATEECAMAR